MPPQLSTGNRQPSRVLCGLCQAFTRLTFWRQNHHHLCNSLCCVQEGEEVQVAEISGDPMAAARLRDLGIREGVIVRVLRHGNPLLVRVDDTRIGLSHSAAISVHVSAVNS